MASDNLLDPCSVGRPAGSITAGLVPVVIVGIAAAMAMGLPHPALAQQAVSISQQPNGTGQFSVNSATNPVYVSSVSGGGTTVTGTVGASQVGAWSVGISTGQTVSAQIVGQPIGVTASLTGTPAISGTVSSQILPTNATANAVAGVGTVASNFAFGTTAVNLFSWSVDNKGTVGAVVALNLAAIPTQTQAISARWCVPIAASGASGYGFASGTYGDLPESFATGLVLAISGGANPCETYTSVTGGIMSARVK